MSGKSVPLLIKNPDVMLLTEFALNTPETDELTRTVKKSKIEGLIRSTGLSARAAANYQMVQDAMALRRRMEVLGLHELQLEEQRVQRDKNKAESKRRAKKSAEARATKERICKKLVRKIDFQPPTKDYYDGLPVAPGLVFVNALCTLAVRFPIRLNVPHTLLFFHEYTWLSTEGGVLKVRKEFKIAEFFACFQQPANPQEIVAALRITDERGNGNKVTLLTWMEFSEHFQKFSFPTYGMLQKVVMSCGTRTTTIRLFHRKEKAASTAFSFFSLTRKMKISTDVKEEDVEVMALCGSAVASLTDIGESVVQSLERGFSLRIQLIVLDLIKDTGGTPWLISCKGLLFDAHSSEIRKKRLEIYSMSPEMKRELQAEQLCAIHCKLCLLPYQHFEMTHVLPFRLLMLYKKHVALNSRILLDLSHIRVNSIDFLSHSVPVCELCFMLITTEYELILAEEQLASLFHIPPDNQSLTTDREITQPNFMPASMHRWRVVLYFKEVECQGTVDSWHLHYTLFGRTHSFRIHPERTSDDLYAMHVARMHYFFASLSPSLKAVCHGIVSQIRCTHTESLNSIFCEGEIHPFTRFSFDFSPGDALCQPIDVLLFTGTAPVMKLHIWVAIVCDKPLPLRQLPISIERVGGLYVPEDCYKTAELLPDVWMEMFEEKKELERTEILSCTEEVEAMYTPRLKTKQFLAFSEGLEHVLHIGFNLNPLSSNRKSARHTRTMSARVVPPILPLTRTNSPAKAPSQIPSRPRTPSNDHEDTLHTLQALIPDGSETYSLARTVSNFLTKRTQSSATRHILSRAHSVAKLSDGRVSRAPTEDFGLLSAGTTIELTQRPRNSARAGSSRSASMGNATKSLALAKTYGCL